MARLPLAGDHAPAQFAQRVQHLLEIRTLLRRHLVLLDVDVAVVFDAAGRFLDISRNATGIYELDFNRAYHPYCYYNPTYECPYPPRENRLKIPIRAGERVKRPKSEGGGLKSEVGSLKSEV